MKKQNKTKYTMIKFKINSLKTKISAFTTEAENLLLALQKFKT